MNKKIIPIILIGSLALSSCKKPETVEEVVPPTTNVQTQVLENFSVHIAQDMYDELAERTTSLYDNVVLLSTTMTDEQQLILCKQNWRDARKTWEHSEAFLFGPVAFENIDPRIDTWPVNFLDLELQLSGSEEFTPEYIDGLQDALKGFHPIEYLLFGEEGDKTADQITEREKEYLTALTLNLKELTGQLATGWHTSTTNNYSHILVNAGQGSTVYSTRLSAYEEMVNAMIGICDEVANGKMNEPFVAQDPSLEESPFAFNSITDFTNNIRGVKAVYQCAYNSDAVGIEDLVRSNNLSLDNTIKLKMDQAIAALSNITVPFGQAITEQPVQVQLAIDAINDLGATLEDELLPYVQLHVQ